MRPMKALEKARDAFERWNLAMALPVMAAVVLYLGFVCEYLPLGNDLTLAAECIRGGGNGRVVPFVWSVLLRLAWLLPGTDTFRLGIVSGASGCAAVAFYVYALGRWLPFACAYADQNAKRDDRSYMALAGLTTLLSGLSFVLAPSMFHAATRLGPTTTEMALAFAPFALASFAMDVERPLTRVYVLTAIGLFAGFAAWEGAPGSVLLPVSFVLVWMSAVRGDVRIANACSYFAIGFTLATLLVMGDGFDIPRLRLAFHLGFVQFLAFAFFPAAVLYRVILYRQMRGLLTRVPVYGAWAAAIVGLGAVILMRDRLDYARAANDCVDEALAQLDGRKWIVSDGQFDDILLFRKPEGTHLVTIRRELDPKHGRQLARWAKEDLAADDNLLLAAELGPSKFLAEWMLREGAATNCLFITQIEPSLPSGHQSLVPGTVCWKPLPAGKKVDVAAAEREWVAAWGRIRPFLAAGEPGAKLITDCFSAQGNAIGCLYRDEKNSVAAVRAYDFAIREISSENLSLLVNLDEMARHGEVADKAVGDRANDLLKTELAGIRNTKQLRGRIKLGGRLFVSEATRARLSKWRDETRLAAWKTPFGMRIREALDRLHAAAALKDPAARQKAIREIETTLSPAISANKGGDWIKHLYLGEVARVKGRSGLEAAQYHFRTMLEEGAGEVRLAFDRLLTVDVALGRPEDIEFDALLVLRYDIRHQYANALLGSVRLDRGDCESAERFLRRAIGPGVPDPRIRNDLAMALSGQGKHRAAEVMIEEVVRDVPGNWHFLDTMAEVYAASGNEAKRREAREKADAAARQSGEYGRYRELEMSRKDRAKKGWF